RVLASWDFDTRALALSEPIKEEWDDKVKKLHYLNREKTLQGLVAEFGEIGVDQKIQNFTDLGPKPFSVIAFHNRFFDQVRYAYVMSAFYPALTGACALGERILNHLILALREDYKASPEYKHVYRKDSFDDWTLAINTLVAWDVLLPNPASNFQSLMRMRHEALHFRPETDHADGPLALGAIKCLQEIIGEQFPGYGPQPWFITDIPGEVYIKKDWETHPFIRKVYLPGSHFVGPRNRVETVTPVLKIVDSDDYEKAVEITDDEFVRMRVEFNGNGQRE
ncbi:MAG: hypothetical protein ABFS45_06505, partial [Pseudomonadota bacterium]